MVHKANDASVLSTLIVACCYNPHGYPPDYKNLNQRSSQPTVNSGTSTINSTVNSGTSTINSDTFMQCQFVK